MTRSNAWLLEFGDEHVAAVGERELLHILPPQEFLEVPWAPPHCAHVVNWQGQLLPVWNVRNWLGGPVGVEGGGIAAVVGYQHRPREMPRYGVIMLAEPPKRVQVDDAQACDLPEGESWPKIASACFMHEDRRVPILYLARMYSGTV